MDNLFADFIVDTEMLIETLHAQSHSQHTTVLPFSQHRTIAPPTNHSHFVNTHYALDHYSECWWKAQPDLYFSCVITSFEYEQYEQQLVYKILLNDGIPVINVK